MNEFNEEPQSYSIDKYPPKTSYLAAEAEYGGRIGTHVVQAKNWRLAFFCSAFICLLCLCGLVAVSMQSKIIPYIVEVDNLTGAVLRVEPITARHQANEQEIQHFIWEVVRKSRTIPKDAVIYRNNWADVYTFLSAETNNKFNDMAARDNQKEKLNSGQTAQLTLKSFNKVTNQDNTYQIRWTEESYENDGRKKSTQEMAGFFTVESGHLKESDIYINPLGMIVKDFSISKEQ